MKPFSPTIRRDASTLNHRSVHHMATEEKIDTMKSFDFAMKSIADLGVSQINLVSETLKSVTPAITSATEGVSTMVSSSIRSVSESATPVVNALSTLGGALLNLASAATGSVVSVAQSGLDMAVNTVNNILPSAKS